MVYQALSHLYLNRFKYSQFRLVLASNYFPTKNDPLLTFYSNLSNNNNRRIGHVPVSNEFGL